MSPVLKIALIFVLFVGSISAVALLAGPEPSPAPPEEPLVFDEIPTEPPPTEAPPTEPPPPARPARASTASEAPEEEPAEITTHRRFSGSGSVSHESGAFSEGGDCGGDSSVKGNAGNLKSDSDDDNEDC